MRKIIPKIVVLLFLMPVLCQATSLVFTSDGTIDGGTYDDVTIMNNATVEMTAGDVDRMYIQNLGTLGFYGGIINDIELRDSSTLNLESASFSGLKLFNSSIFNLDSGTFSGILEKYEYCQTNIYGGEILNGQLLSNNFGVTNIYNGDISWDGVDLHQYSTLNIYGGDVLFNNGFWLDDDAEINVFYSSVIVQERPYEILGYHLLDGSEFMLDQFTEYEIGQINFVPEPATLWLLGLGGLVLTKKRRMLS